ncbi:MAG: hypothetical protein K2M88_03630, partial [Muribaculaceae bacterium]|nr:hypothetical protein [Muribaculaceae bacterium]
MKIIAIEEHTENSAIGAAVARVVKENVPYIATFASPDLTGSAPAGALTDMDKGRIEDMDKNGITMEILSYSNPSQWILDE